MPDQIKNQFNDSTFNNPVFHNYGAVKIARTLATAGAGVPPTFLGREKELKKIRTLLTSNSTIALVNAEGGMGKTTLAAAYWQKHQHEYQHLAWLFCEDGILSTIRSQLPTPLSLNKDLEQVANDPKAQIQRIKNCMANLDKDCLLVLDNANEPAQIKDFLREMSGMGWHILITSRCSKVMPQANSEFKIKSLPPDLAKELFENNYKEDSPDFETLLDRFLQAVGYNTLCIEVFSKTLQEGNAWGMTMEKMLQSLEENGLTLGEDSFEIRSDYTHNVRKEAASSDEIMEVLYDWAKLTPEELNLLLQIALLPAENHPPKVLAALLSAESPNVLKRQLDGLVGKGWLSSDTHSYRISPVVQKIVLNKNADRRWEVGAPMVAKLHDIFQHEGYHTKDIKTASLFAGLIFTLVEHLGTANDDNARLFDRLWIFHNATGDLLNALNTAERMQETCKTYYDKNGLAISYENLGSTHAALGDLKQALMFYEKRSDIGKQLFEDYPNNVAFKNGLAISYSKLGSTHAALGDLKQALMFYMDQTKLFEQLFEDFPNNVAFKNGLAISYQNLGETYATLGDLKQALMFYMYQSKLFEQLFEDFPNNVIFKNGLAISYQYLGNAHAALDDLKQALIYYERYNEIEKQLFEDYPYDVNFKNLLAVSYAKLGEFYRDYKGDMAKTKEYFQQCYDLWKALHRDHPDYAVFKRNYEWVERALGKT